MGDVDTFLTTVYVLVDEVCQQEWPNERVGAEARSGPAPALSRSEVITLALFAQWTPFTSERAFYRYAERHLGAAFPALPARSQFNRQLCRQRECLVAVGLVVARRLEQAVRAQRRAGEPCPYEIVDGMGVATRTLKRRGGGWLAQVATLGRCTRLGWYKGVHLLTAVTPQGVLSGYGIAPAHTKDQPLAETFFAARHTPQPRLPEVGHPVADGLYLADSGYEGRRWHTHWEQDYAATVIVRPKATDPHPWSPAFRRSFAGLRQIVETVHARLLDTFGLGLLRPHSPVGLRAHLAAKLVAYNVALWLNLQWHRPLLAFADLLDW